jgi:AbiU2
MALIDPEIASLRARVKAAVEEFDLAVVCHEVWKPTAYDEALHQRMGASYATNAFRVIVTALRREVLLGMTRLWDKSRGNVRMEDIARTLRKRGVVDTLAVDRAARFNDANIEAEMREDMRRQAREVLNLIDSYVGNGRNAAVLEKLLMVRHERLAHRQVEPLAATGPGLTDAEIEAFYQHNSRIISLLSSLILGVGYDPQETAGVFHRHASYFWAAARGERTEGHPNYRPPPNTAFR